MRIKTISITWELGNGNEKEVAELLSRLGGKANLPEGAGVKEKEEVAYVPGSERARLALDALSKCKRVSILRPQVLDAWSAAFPHVDLAGEIAKCEAWAESKGVTRTPRGWQKALNSWLSKAQDSTRGNTYNSTVPAKVAAPVAIEEETRKWIEAAQ